MKKRLAKVTFERSCWVGGSSGELHLGPFIRWECWAWGIGFDLFVYCFEICFHLEPVGGFGAKT
jgi:hypothetical protein